MLRKLRFYHLFLAVTVLLAVMCGAVLLLAPATTARQDRVDVVQRLEATMRPQWAARFRAAQVAFPPPRFTLLAFKEEKTLEVWAQTNPTLPPRLIHTWPFTASSGGLGPKLREGDRQIPEGVYAIESLNPNSRYHLSLRVNYPNRFDREKGKADGREFLGGDIMIHGKAVTIGCIPIGDEAIEELYWLASVTGIRDGNIGIIIAPYDFRRLPERKPKLKGLPAWTPELYNRIRNLLRLYPLPEK